MSLAELFVRLLGAWLLRILLGLPGYFDLLYMAEKAMNKTGGVINGAEAIECLFTCWALKALSLLCLKGATKFRGERCMLCLGLLCLLSHSYHGISLLRCSL